MPDALKRRLLVLLALACGLVAGGCAALCPARPAAARTARGLVRLADYASCRRLGVVAHTCRRDRSGHLVVRVCLQNFGSRPFRARLQMRWWDAGGRLLPGSELTGAELLPPGKSTLEFASESAGAERYVLEVRSARFLPW